jgi:imidazole glycerol-phosphate synthase subunit HisH
MIAILDYGVGNVGSIANLLRKVGSEAVVTGDAAEIARAEKLILPGVGSFDQGMRELRARGFVDLLDRRVREERVPILGICLGMQLFARGSEEGGEPGLGWIDAEVVRFCFPPEARRKVPHMGWNTVQPASGDEPDAWFDGADRFYFVHAYHMICRDEAVVLGRTTYGDSFVSAVRQDNVIGVQFHPEKSHRFGMKLLRRFVEARC